MHLFGIAVFFKLWEMAPNPEAERVGCERSNLPVCSVSLTVLGQGACEEAVF